MKMLSSILAALIAFAPLGQAASVSNPTFDKIIQGRSNSTTKEYRFNLNLGNANPGFRGNATTGKVEFSQDGSLWKNVGSGAGGGGGITLNDNSGFEDGAGGWTASGGTFAVTQTVANVAFGNSAGSWTPSAIGQTLSYSPILIPTGLQGKTGTISIYTKGGDTGYVFEVTDGTNAIATSSPLATTTGYSAKKVLAFTYPASGSITLRLRTLTAAPAQIFVDDFKVGQEFLLGAMPQGGALAATYLSSGCSQNYNNSATSISELPAAGCTISITGDTVNFTQLGTQWPGMNVKADPAYVYLFEAVGGMGPNTYSGSATTIAQFKLFDGTTEALENNVIRIDVSAGQGNITLPRLHGVFRPTVAGTYPVRFRGFGNTSAAGSYIGGNVVINVYKYPKSVNVDAAQGLTVDQTGWKINGDISAASNDLGLGNNATRVPPTDANLEMSLDPGSATAAIPCAGTVDATGLTCSGASETVGVSFTPPTAGDVEVCFAFTHYMNTAAGGTVVDTFSLVETGNTNQTIVQSPKGALTSGGSYSSGNNASYFSNNVCGTFTFADTSRRTVRLNYTQSSSAANASNIVLNRAAGATTARFSVRRKTEISDVVKVTQPTYRSELKLATVAGMSSTSTFSPYYSTVDTFTGSDFSYVNNATSGLVVTILNDGLYNLAATHGSNTNGTTVVVAITKNYPNSVSAESIPSGNVIVRANIGAISGAQANPHVGRTTFLPAGTTIRVNSNSTSPPITPTYSEFAITRVGN